VLRRKDEVDGFRSSGTFIEGLWASSILPNVGSNVFKALPS